MYIYIYIFENSLSTHCQTIFSKSVAKEKINKFTSLSYHQNESRSATDTSDALKNV